MRASLLLALACCCALPAQAADAGADRVAVPLDAATLAALPHEAVSADAHGHHYVCEGVPLVALLRQAGAMPEGELRGAAQLARFVEAGARDGYRVAFSLGELDPATGARRVYVVDRCDGKPLGDDGPLRLIVPDDARPARWVRQLDSITVSTP
ncbi:MAG: hypothetical protein QM719_09675 [Thermomonas sp.]